MVKKVKQAGLEPATSGLRVRCAIHSLSLALLTTARIEVSEIFIYHDIVIAGDYLEQSGTMDVHNFS